MAIALNPIERGYAATSVRDDEAKLSLDVRCVRSIRDRYRAGRAVAAGRRDNVDLNGRPTLRIGSPSAGNRGPERSATGRSQRAEIQSLTRERRSAGGW